jgi:hypothetical protein
VLAILHAIGASIAQYEFPMIRANCRARFTAADFDFIVRTLARSQTDHVSLADLLSDVETRDSILGHPLVQRNAFRRRDARRRSRLFVHHDQWPKPTPTPTGFAEIVGDYFQCFSNSLATDR